jgi:hypothetical protein
MKQPVECLAQASSCSAARRARTAHNSNPANKIEVSNFIKYPKFDQCQQRLYVTAINAKTGNYDGSHEILQEKYLKPRRMSINISWSSEEGVRNIRLPLPLATIDALYDHVEQQLGVALSRRSHVFTDTSKDILSDEDVAALQDGATLVVASRDDGALAAPAHERISFQPHPKTLTMAGDYEYFAAQVRHQRLV